MPPSLGPLGILQGPNHLSLTQCPPSMGLWLALLLQDCCTEPSVAHPTTKMLILLRKRGLCPSMSTHRVVITITRTFCSHTMRQKSP